MSVLERVCLHCQGTRHILRQCVFSITTDKLLLRGVICTLFLQHHCVSLHSFTAVQLIEMLEHVQNIHCYRVDTNMLEKDSD